MSKSGYIQCALSLLLVAYLVTVLFYTSAAAKIDTFNGLQINIVDSISRGFVTSDAIDSELGQLKNIITQTRRDSLNTYEIEQKILSMDKIEKANCVILNDGTLRIDVTPLMPIARVFDNKGGDFYINRAGKRMESSPRYRIDVPVITGDFNPNRDPSLCFPVLDYLAQHPDLSALVSAIEIKNNRDIIIVPSIMGHVINLGSSEDLPNKFDRVSVFYKKVMPARGWEYYDTLTVKWRGQLVAHRRYAKAPTREIVVEEHDDIDDVATMSSPQALPPITRGRETPSSSIVTKDSPDEKKAEDKTNSDDKKADDKKADDKKADDKKADGNVKDSKKSEKSDSKHDQNKDSKPDSKKDNNNNPDSKKQA